MSPRVSDQYKEEKRQELLGAARRVFIKKGYVKTTMQDIMEEAKVSRGALYSYFNNIQHVFEELLKSEDESDIYIFQKDSKSSTWQQLVEWIRAQKENIEAINQSLLLCKSEFFLTTYGGADKVRNPYLTERYEKLAESIKKFLEAGVERKELSPCMPLDAIPLYIISFIDGLMLDTFNLGAGVTKVDKQLDILLFTLKGMLCPL